MMVLLSPINISKHKKFINIGISYKIIVSDVRNSQKIFVKNRRREKTNN